MRSKEAQSHCNIHLQQCASLVLRSGEAPYPLSLPPRRAACCSAHLLIWVCPAGAKRPELALPLPGHAGRTRFPASAHAGQQTASAFALMYWLRMPSSVQGQLSCLSILSLSQALGKIAM